MGARSARRRRRLLRSAPQASTTVRLPQARRPAPAPSRRSNSSAPVPSVEPIVAPPTPVIEQPPARQARRRLARSKPANIAKTDEAPEGREPPPPALQPWPVRVDRWRCPAGWSASERSFRAHQAKRGWWAITKVNPALKHLPALVVPVQSLRNGQVYYRLQMGTTSQAHSDSAVPADADDRRAASSSASRWLPQR